ncbi:MAG: diguanylate cyclase [Azospirillaceae bacterium]|nr:diguanylate cyclase [Azospirillaceae bacterium]
MSWAEIARPGRILIVDDAAENVRVLHHALKDEHEVVFALNGEKALEISRTQAIDLVLLDAVMPDMDGYAVCAELKSTAQTWDLPIIFVTVLNGPEDEARALEAGAVDFISKPINEAVVRARVRTQLTLKRQSDLLRKMAFSDGLTGIANRRGFDVALDREWRRCERAGLSIALILIDIDCFKTFNDHYGHQSGDGCLIKVATALGECVHRAADLVARYGGEEFVVLLPQEDIDGARAVAENILEHVRALMIPHARSSCAPMVTVSAGVAAMVPNRDTPAGSMISVADSRLYQAKTAGRNRLAFRETPSLAGALSAAPAL